MFLQQTDKMLATLLVALQTATHASLEGAIGCCGDALAVFKAALFIDRDRINSHSQLNNL